MSATPRRPPPVDPASVPPRTDAPVLNLANALTVVRLALVPVFLLTLFAGGGEDPAWRWASFVVFGLAAVTDRLDGQIARSRNLVTSFGKIADPIADKALMGSALIGLSVLGDLPWWVTVVILVREIGVTLLRFWVIKRGVIAASRGGKLKTLLQTLAIGLYLLPYDGWLGTLRAWLMAAAVVVTLVTGLDYVGRALRLRRAVPAGGHG